MDNGKPFRESRDADVPIVVRHFYHHAGWAQLMDSEMRGWKSIGKCSFHCTFTSESSAVIRVLEMSRAFVYIIGKLR